MAGYPVPRGCPVPAWLLQQALFQDTHYYLQDTHQLRIRFLPILSLLSHKLAVGVGYSRLVAPAHPCALRHKYIHVQKAAPTVLLCNERL